MGYVKTYQDLLEVGESEQRRMQFVKDAINAHKGSALYQQATIANDYDKQRNVTIMNYVKLLQKVTGEVIPDEWSPNYKLCSNFFHRLITQVVEYLLGNGVTWGKPSRPISEATAQKYPQDEVFKEDVWDENLEMYIPQWYVKGTDKKVGEDFDQRLQEMAQEAYIGEVSFGFWNYDHLEVFHVREFVPLYDEENGALMAGIRFWQVNPDKPLRATLYEVDGVTDYIWKKNATNGEIKEAKRGYTQKTLNSAIDGERIYDGENYERFPIVPMWTSRARQSALVGLRENIDAYDLLKSGLCNTIDETAEVYWVLNNADGMHEEDLVKFTDSIRRTHTAMVDNEGTTAEAHTLDVPINARDSALDRLRNDMYDDFMAVDTKNIASGATTATQIQASYEPMNSKADELEFCVLDFIQSILAIAGIEDKATFTRSIIVNRLEEVQILTQSAMTLPEEYLTKRILTVLGDSDAYDRIQREKDMEDMESRPMTGTETNDDEETTEEPQEGEEETPAEE